MAVKAHPIVALPFPIQDVSHLYGQFVEIEGLCEQMHTSVEATLVDDRIPSIAGGKEHLEAGTKTTCLGGHLGARHPTRQYYIGEEKIDISLLFNKPYSGCTIVSFQDSVAKLAK
jgi:hypothetical protein